MAKADTETTQPLNRPAKVVSITKNGGMTTKAKAEPEPADEDLEEYGPRVFSPGKAAAAGAVVGLWLYVIYGHLGAPHADGSGIVGALIGFVIVAAVIFILAYVLVHILHLHHRSILAWLGSCAAHGAAWLGKSAERLLNGAYIRLAALVSAGSTAVMAWWNDWRHPDQNDEDQAEDPDDIPAGSEPAQEPERAPEPAPPAEATAAADPARNGVPVTTSTDAPARRAGSRFGGRRTFAEAKPLINLIDDANPADGDEIDHHDLMLALAATLYDLAQAWEGYTERCESPGVRIGKGAMQAANALAESLTDAAEGAANASKGFENYYEGVNEEVAGGKELPKDGDFLTGQGAGG